MMIFLLPVAIVLLLILGYLGSCIVPHQEAWIVQRLGKYRCQLDSGPHWIVPFIDVVSYRHCLKEESIFVPEQTAITQDNVNVTLDGIVYVKIVDPIAASYGVKDPIHAVIQLVQTTMRSEIGKLPLDQTFEERESLNSQIVDAINKAATPWGIRCLRYEIKDIKMPEDVRKAMELQMTAEREKRAHILKSEGLRQAKINESEGQKQAQINIAEASQIDRVNRARGEAEAIAALAEATASSLERLSCALNQTGGEKAASLQIAEKYLEAFRELAKEGNTIVLPANLEHPSHMVVQAMSLYQQIHKKTPSAILSSLESSINK